MGGTGHPRPRGSSCSLNKHPLPNPGDTAPRGARRLWPSLEAACTATGGSLAHEAWTRALRACEGPYASSERWSVGEGGSSQVSPGVTPPGQRDSAQPPLALCSGHLETQSPRPCGGAVPQGPEGLRTTQQGEVPALGGVSETRAAHVRRAWEVLRCPEPRAFVEMFSNRGVPVRVEGHPSLKPWGAHGPCAPGPWQLAHCPSSSVPGCGLAMCLLPGGLV